MSRTRAQHPVSGLATAALVSALGFWSQAGAAEVHFVVQDLGEKRALWVPQEVVIHRSTEMEDGLVFILENPTDRTHAFAAHGLFEEVMGSHGDITSKPLRVNVTSEDRVLVQISRAQFEGEPAVSEEETYAFFCPLHKGDAHLGGTIHVVP